MDEKTKNLLNKTFEESFLNFDSDFHFDNFLGNKEFIYFKNKDNLKITIFNKLKKPKSYTLSISSEKEEKKSIFSSYAYVPSYLREPEVTILLHKEHKKPLSFSISLKPLEYPTSEKEIICNQFEESLKEKNSFLLCDSFYEGLFNLGRFCIYNNVKKFTKFDMRNLQEQIDMALLLNDAVLPLTREQKKKKM